MEIKQAEAQKKAAIGQNNAAKEVAESNAELEVTKAEASRKAGEAQALSLIHIFNERGNIYLILYQYYFCHKQICFSVGCKYTSL